MSNAREVIGTLLAALGTAVERYAMIAPWWVAARSMGEASDLVSLEMIQPYETVQCREAVDTERPSLSGPRNVEGEDPWDLMRLDADCQARLLGWVDRLAVTPDEIQRAVDEAGRPANEKEE